MGSNLVKLTDKTYMTELEERIRAVNEENLNKRISSRVVRNCNFTQKYTYIMLIESVHRSLLGTIRLENHAHLFTLQICELLRSLLQ